MAKLHKSSFVISPEAITEKIAIIFVSTHFMSVLTEGSQARKTGSDKKMVLV